MSWPNWVASCRFGCLHEIPLSSGSMESQAALLRAARKHSGLMENATCFIDSRHGDTTRTTMTVQTDACMSLNNVHSGPSLLPASLSHPLPSHPPSTPDSVSSPPSHLLHRPRRRTVESRKRQMSSTSPS